MTEPKNEMSAEEQAAAQKKAKAKILHHPHLGVGYFGAARRHRPALAVRYVQTAGQTEHH